MTEEIRAEEIKFMPEIEKVIKDNFGLFPQDITKLELSTTEEDTRESFDIVYKSKVEISVRIRNYYALQWGDFTIRGKSKYGGKTEIDKLREGMGSIYLYAWKTEDNNHFESWILVDINKIRPGLRGEDKPDLPFSTRKRMIYNDDETAFYNYKIQWIKERDGLINYYNING